MFREKFNRPKKRWQASFRRTAQTASGFLRSPSRFLPAAGPTPAWTRSRSAPRSGRGRSIATFLRAMNCWRRSTIAGISADHAGHGRSRQSASRPRCPQRRSTMPNTVVDRLPIPEVVPYRLPALSRARGLFGGLESVPHSRVPRQGDQIPKRLLGDCQQFLFGLFIQATCVPAPRGD